MIFIQEEDCFQWLIKEEGYCSIYLKKTRKGIQW